MFANERRAILVETVGKKHRDVVKPCVTRSGTKQDPLVLLGDVDEAFDPCSVSDDSLFVEDEEGVLNIVVPPEIVPRIHSQFYTGWRSLSQSADSELDCLPLPVVGVSLLGCRDDVDVHGGAHGTEVAIHTPTDLAHEVGHGCDGLTHASASSQDITVGQLLNGLALMWLELNFHSMLVAVVGSVLIQACKQPTP